jgi:long-chain acyl-CoA synthetase
MEMKVVDENDGELLRGQVGELILRCPMVMQGYFKEPEQTARAMRGGWLHTGDLVSMDAERCGIGITISLLTCCATNCGKPIRDR